MRLVTSMRVRATVVVLAGALIAASCGSSAKSASKTTTLPATTAPGGSVVPSTAPGVTASTITIGTVADVSGPIPGLFQGALNGVQAYVDYVNSQGGVDGRKLVMKSGDSGLTCQLTQTATQTLAAQVFAMVGSFAEFDNCEVPPLQAHPNLPNIQYPLTSQLYGYANNYASQYKVPGWMTGYDTYIAQKYPDTVNAVGGLYGNTLASQQGWKEQKGALQSVGFKIIVEDSFPQTQTDFTADVIKMRNAGVKLVYANQTSGTNIAQFLNAAAAAELEARGGAEHDGLRFELSEAHQSRRRGQPHHARVRARCTWARTAPSFPRSTPS